MYFISTTKMLAVSAAILMGILTAVTIRRRRLKTKKAAEKNTSFFVVKEIFTQIIEARAVLEIMVERDEQEMLACSGTCIHVSEQFITIELHKSYLQKEDLHKSIHGYCTFIQQGKRHFYDFKTSIDKIYEQDSRLYLDLHRPDLISNNQKRRFVRFEPSPSMFRSLQLWIMHVEKQEQEQNENALPQHFSLHAVAAEELTVHNISAGGLLLGVRSEPSTLAELARSRFLVCRMVMTLEPEVDAPAMELRVVSKVCRITQTGANTLSFGLEFLRWFQPSEGVHPSWHAIDPDEGIPDLAAAVMRMERIARLKQMSIKPLETLPEVLGTEKPAK